jgi:hypothetical protein
MPRKQHIVRLRADDRRMLHTMVRTGHRSAWSLQRARILLAADAATEDRARTDAEVAAVVGVSARTVARTRAALERARARVRRAQSAGASLGAAQALRCADFEDRRRCLHRAAPGVCSLVVAAADPACHRAGHRRDRLPGNRPPSAPKRGLQPWRTVRFLIPPERDASFVTAMEAVLDTYALPPNPAVPLICFDETGKELQAARRTSWPGPPVREDPEYVRAGSANCFLAYAPHLGWRHLIVSAQRTAVDWALAMRALVDNCFPDAERLIVVLDNLNTHRLSSLYTAFPAPEAQRLARKLELRYTPKHGSWLNLAEGELSVLARQCLDRRIPDRATLAAEVAAWETARNAVAAPAQWTFTVDDARTRLHHLYPIPVCDTSMSSED